MLMFVDLSGNGVEDSSSYERRKTRTFRRRGRNEDLCISEVIAVAGEVDAW